ncbi:3-oxoadipate enol-lactonase [Paraburkholderia lycopersici]|uniref:3-oxoadipate enol-lactonase n=1 Tax=Paraburkholderia lycopersici TaxID=416944 RepID=A0A1G6GWG3_9BURK|nr:3-oxoadipate enol-lactonase [Paraburkholderia lycopersici]SDB86382.1 3-oxoadipate enol-lactonase [Paraburkholderia lycopersici]
MQVTVNGIDTHYVFDDRSGGPALAFIHQLGGDHSVWDTLAGHFRHRHSVLRYDVRGHGASAVAGEPFGFAQLAADLAALLDANDIEHVHLVGMSMGGMIAQQFALDYPQRVVTLALCDTASHTPPEARAIWNERAATVRRDGLAALADATMARWFSGDFRHAHAQTVSQIRDVLLRTPSEGYAMACEALRDFDVQARLAQLRVPALAVAGRYDNGTPPTATQALAKSIEGSHFVVLDAAHLAPVEESHRFTALLETFLKQLV